MKNEKETNHASLFEFLGAAAGPELGQTVAAAAKKAGVKPSSHEVKTRKYTGKILRYPITFLNAFFIINPDLLTPYGKTIVL